MRLQWSVTLNDLWHFILSWKPIMNGQYHDLLQFNYHNNDKASNSISLKLKLPAHGLNWHLRSRNGQIGIVLLLSLRLKTESWSLLFMICIFIYDLCRIIKICQSCMHGWYCSARTIQHLSDSNLIVTNTTSDDPCLRESLHILTASMSTMSIFMIKEPHFNLPQLKNSSNTGTNCISVSSQILYCFVA